MKTPKINGIRSTRRKPIALLLAIMMVLALIPAQAFAQTGAASGTTAGTEASKVVPAPDWNSFRGAVSSKGITAMPTPAKASDTAKKWVKAIIPATDMCALSNPLIINDKIYIAVATGWPSSEGKLLVFSLAGKLLKSKALTTDVNPATGKTYGIPILPFIGAGGGMVYVPLTDGTIRAYDLDTLAMKWKTEPLTWTDNSVSTSPAIVPFDLPCPIIYKGGYIYTGTASGGTGVPGKYFAVNATSPAPASKVKKLAWTYQADSGSDNSHYAVGAAFTKNAVIFAGSDGFLVSHALKNNTVLSKCNINAGVKSELVSSGNDIFVTTITGKLVKATVASSGKIIKSSVKTVTLSGAKSVSAPVVYRNKVYAISGTQNFTGKGVGKLDVISKSGMKKLSTVDLGDYVSGSPLLTKAYATKSNGYRVLIYVVRNAVTDDNIMVVKDSDQLKAPMVSTLFKPGGSQGQASLIAGKAGNLYFYQTITDTSTWMMSANLMSIGGK